ncbi:MAG: GTP-binding protein [Candidatus Lokiarchaeota archaeon]|nr:GTP-binding protein [Candidatus Lokiarchaeota archaeon]
MDDSQIEKKHLIYQSKLNEVLSNLLETLPQLNAALVVDFDGLFIANQSKKKINESILSAVMALIDTTMKRIKTLTTSSIGSGIFNIDEYQLIFMELGEHTPAILVLLTDTTSNLDDIIPYLYIIGEKVSQILNARNVSLFVPKINPEKIIFIETHEKPSNAENLLIKLIVLGDVAVGKSSLMNLFVNGEFEHDYIPTVGISIFEKEMQISNKVKIIYQIFDTSGLRSYRKVRKIFLGHSEIVLIIFDFTRLETLENIEKWIEESKNFISGNDVIYFLIGNKIDLIEYSDELRQIAKNIADRHNYQFFITSAITGEGIDEVFTSLLTIISNKKSIF